MSIDEYKMVSDELISWRRKDMYIKWYRSNVSRIFIEHKKKFYQLIRKQNELTEKQKEFIGKLKIHEAQIMHTVDEYQKNNNQSGFLLTELKLELDSYIK